MIDKLLREGGKYFRITQKHVVNLDDWQKDESREYFFNIELLSEAIEKKVQVEFIYNSYGTDKKLHSRKSEKSLVIPISFFLKNEHYYLACNYDKYDNIVYCRIDKFPIFPLCNRLLIVVEY